MSTETKNLLNRIERVRSKVAERQLHLNNCRLTQREIEEFEEGYQIRLPEDYRRFLSEIGNGGSGPLYYGLVLLAKTIETEEGRKLNPGLPFPLTEYWMWEEDVNWDKGRSDVLDAVFSNGHLFLGTDGCGIDWILMITGPERGSVWNRADVGAQPCMPQRDFLSWYEYWLDGNDDWWKDIES